MLNEEKDLKNVNETHGFKTPDGYFTTLRENILSKTVNKDERGFTIPDGYFNTSRQRILSHTIHRPKAQMVVWYKRGFVRLAAAAVLIAGMTLVFNLTNQQNHYPVAKGEPSNDEIFSYFESNPDGDVIITEISYIASPEEKPITGEENYLINQAEEQLFIEEL